MVSLNSNQDWHLDGRDGDESRLIAVPTGALTFGKKPFAHIQAAPVAAVQLLLLVGGVFVCGGGFRRRTLELDSACSCLCLHIFVYNLWQGCLADRVLLGLKPHASLNTHLG